MAFVKVDDTTLGEQVTPAPYTVNYDVADLQIRLTAAQARLLATQDEITWLTGLLAQATSLGIGAV